MPDTTPRATRRAELLQGQVRGAVLHAWTNQCRCGCVYKCFEGSILPLGCCICKYPPWGAHFLLLPFSPVLLAIFRFLQMMADVLGEVQELEEANSKLKAE